MTTTPYDQLVDICNKAIADTHKWERRAKWSTWIFRVLATLNAVMAGINLATASWILALVNTLMVALMVFMLRFNRNHLAWVLETRVKWQANLEKYLFNRTEYVENGYHY